MLWVSIQGKRQEIWLTLYLIACCREQWTAGGQRQGDLETCSFAEFAFDVDVAAVVADDAVADGEAQPGPFADLLSGEERVVDLRQVFGRNAEAGVADFDHGGIFICLG